MAQTLADEGYTLTHTVTLEQTRTLLTDEDVVAWDVDGWVVSEPSYGLRA